MTNLGALQAAARDPSPQRLQLVRQCVGPLRDIAGAETDDKIAAAGDAVHHAREFAPDCGSGITSRWPCARRPSTNWSRSMPGIGASPAG